MAKMQEPYRNNVHLALDVRLLPPVPDSHMWQ